MPRLHVELRKALKLVNVLICRVSFSDLQEEQGLERYVNKMQNYIKVKGAEQVGPLIQYNELKVDKYGNIQMEHKMMLQSNVLLNNVESPYDMEENIYVLLHNCSLF